jgi:hypothetical protein
MERMRGTISRTLREKLQAAAEAGRNARRVRQRHGVSYLRQAAEASLLKALGVDLNTYFTYGLFDRRRVADLATMLTHGNADISSREFAHFAERDLHGLATHKHLLYLLLPALDLPAPRIRAVYCPAADGFARHRAMTRQGQLSDYLLTTDHLPLFGKPSRAQGGRGAMGLRRRAADGRLELSGGERVAPPLLARRIHELVRAGGSYLLTELLRQRDDLRALCGTTLASLRIVVLMRRGEPLVHAAVVLLPRARSETSNWGQAGSNALCGAVDVESGRIHTVLSSLGPDRALAPVHPDTGARLEGHRLRGWDEVLALMDRVGRALSPFRMQHWDLALTTRGPVLLDLNVEASVIPLQMHGPPGVYTPTYREFAATHRVW